MHRRDFAPVRGFHHRIARGPRAQDHRVQREVAQEARPGARRRGLRASLLGSRGCARRREGRGVGGDVPQEGAQDRGRRAGGGGGRSRRRRRCPGAVHRGFEQVSLLLRRGVPERGRLGAAGFVGDHQRGARRGGARGDAGHPGVLRRDGEAHQAPEAEGWGDRGAVRGDLPVRRSRRVLSSLQMRCNLSSDHS